MVKMNIQSCLILAVLGHFYTLMSVQVTFVKAVPEDPDPVHSEQKEEPKVPEDPRQPFKFQSSPVKSEHGHFIRKAMDIIINKGLYQGKPLEKLVFLSPDELEKSFDFSLSDKATSQNKLLNLIEKLFDITPKASHRYRLNRRVSGLDPLAVIGDWMATTMSNNVVAYNVGPIWTLMEIRLTEYLCRKIGWDKLGDGVSTSGAGVANSMAMAIAMNRLDPKTRDIGLFHYENQFRIYVSQHASISWKTAAIYNGVGLNSIVEVEVDQWGRMKSTKLESAITNDKQFGHIPLMVVATGGAPVMGVIDPIDSIAKVCAHHRVWLHVDAELAGGYLFSNRTTGGFRNKLHGIERADSVSVSMWLYSAPYPSSMLLSKNPEALEKAFGLHATYVYTGIDIYNMSYDKGDHTIQTSRRPEIAKMWFAAARGLRRSSDLFEKMDSVKEDAIEKLKKLQHDGFVVVKTSKNAIGWQVPLVSFYYVPTSLRGSSIDGAFNQKVSEVTRSVHTELQKRGLADLSLSTIPSDPNTPTCLTISFTSARLFPEEVDWLLDTIKKLGENPTTTHVSFPTYTVKDSSDEEYPNFPLKKTYAEVVKDVFEIAFDKGIFFSRRERVFDFKQPEFFNNSKHFDFSFPFSGNQLLHKIKILFKSIIRYSPHWAHPYFIYQLGAGVDPYTIVADYIVPVLNTPMISFHDGSGPFMLMEQELVKKVLKRVYKTEVGDGTITDGGSMLNQIAIAMAKFHLDGSNFKYGGYRATRGRKYVIYISGDAHYSTKKGAIFQGLGQNNTIEVEATNIGKMKVDKFEQAIARTKRNGDQPLMAVITTGTTVYGAIDPIQEIVKVAKRNGIWVHVDAAFGGLLALSDTYINKFDGIEWTDSWGADLHKLMGSTMVCTILVTKHKGMLRNVFSLPDELQENPSIPKLPENLSLVGRHPQLDKRNNVLKFWLLWKAKGRLGLQEHVDKIMSNKDYLIAEIRKREAKGFELVIQNYELTNVCFRYIPPHLNPRITPDVDRNSTAWAKDMDSFTFALEKEFVKNGMICFVTQRRHAVEGDTLLFIKFVMMGSAITEDDIQFLLDAVAFYGSKIDLSRSRARNLDQCKQNHFDPFGNMPKYYNAEDAKEKRKTCHQSDETL